MSRPSALFLSQMSDADLLTYCENQFDELVTSSTEEALMIKFRDFVDEKGGSVPFEDVSYTLSEVLAQMPDEDFLAEVKDDLHRLSKSKRLTKAEILDWAKEIAEQLDEALQTQAHAAEHARDCAKDYLPKKEPKP